MNNDDQDGQMAPEFDKAAVWAKIEDGIGQLFPPPCVMGTVYIGGMKLRYDISGGVALTFSTGLDVVFAADHTDPSSYVQAEAMGYGRQVGLLTRDRILMHCLLCDMDGTEPLYLVEGPMCWANRVDIMLMQLNSCHQHARPHSDDEAIVSIARFLLFGVGVHFDA